MLARLEARPRTPRQGKPTAPRALRASSWNQTDVFLICYPDQVTDPPGSLPCSPSRPSVAITWWALFGGIHLLPFFPSSSDDGFSVTDYRQVDPAFGSWEDVNVLGGDFRLMVDLVAQPCLGPGRVVRRLPPGRAALRRLLLPSRTAMATGRASFVRARTPLFTSFDTSTGPRQVWTTFGPDQVDLDYRRPEVLLEMVDVMLDYIGHGAEVIRLDAVAYVGKRSGTTCQHQPETHAVVKLLRLAARAAAPWVRLITETNVPHADGLTYFGDGDEADLVYSFALPPLVVYALTTGDARPLTEWVGSLTPPPGEGALFHFLASHDGIGLNGAAGWLSDEQTGALVERRRPLRGGLLPLRRRRRSSRLRAQRQPAGHAGGRTPRGSRCRTQLCRDSCARTLSCWLWPGSRRSTSIAWSGRGATPTPYDGAPSPRSINRRETGAVGARAGAGSARLACAGGSSTGWRGCCSRRRAQLPFTRGRRRSSSAVSRTASSGSNGRALDGAQRLICLARDLPAGRPSSRPAGGEGRDVLTGESLRLDDIALGPYQVRWIEVVP